jgi:hypothetical protein
MIEKVGTYLKLNQGVLVPKKAESTGDFATYVQALLKPEKANNVNEEELFAGLIQERLKALKGDEVASKYREELDKEVAIRTRADGYIPWEDVAKAALRKIRDAGVLNKDETNKVYSEAFEGAQLDNNLDALYDGRGSASDPTIAFMEINAALEKARAKIEGFAKEAAKVRELDSIVQTGGAPAGNPLDGPEGFLFKPVSDTRGTLVVLLPKQMTGNIESVVLKALSGEEIERGLFSGVANGDREHFRFTKPGSQYPRDLVVEVKLKDGSYRTYNIEDPSRRYD